MAVLRNLRCDQPNFFRYEILATIVAVKLSFHLRQPTLLLLLVGCILAAGCTASFGPGYVIDKQNIDVRFVPGPPPHIAIKSSYELTNNGTMPLPALELRLPGRRRFKATDLAVKWDGQELSLGESPENSRNSLLTFGHAWAISEHHTLEVVMDLQTAEPDESHLAFSSDAFFLPAQGWTAELLPARGIFATGGLPPAKWELAVHVPKGFLVHSSGDKIKTKMRDEELEVRATQRVADIYPYVIAGRYVSKQIGSSRDKIYLWTRQEQVAGNARQVSDSLVKILDSYNAEFGERSVAQAPAGFLRRRHSPGKNEPPLWLVECPVIPGCFSEQNSRNERLFGPGNEETAGEMISLDSVMIDARPGSKRIISGAAPALAASWLGYGQSPGFYEQVAPLSALPAFAAAVGEQTLKGPTSRVEMIRRALAVLPKQPRASQTEDAKVTRAKSFLFFYGLEDRYGKESFRKAIRHMLDARRSGGFDLDDLIAAFDQETHKNTAEFVRLWMKHPGVPADFRAKYENNAADRNAPSKEVTP
jgi:hypothetical protein